MLQNKVFPFFQEGRAAVPIKRMLEDDDIVVHQQLLFAWHVNAEIRVFFIEIVECHILQVPHGSDEPSINPGFLEGRVSKLNQNSVSHGLRADKSCQHIVFRSSR